MIERRTFLGSLLAIASAPFLTFRAAPEPKPTVVDIDWFQVFQRDGETQRHWTVKYRIDGGPWKTEQRTTDGDCFQITDSTSIIFGWKQPALVEDYSAGVSDNFGIVGNWKV